ncbi:MAG: Asp-tRNA(Asn)/Glu-tRNA(Gln) amidotransferase subunit GatC [Candidatus Omnitrophica bacterium]|nr:Asp-tRNA(Asn)/Glu-tRNA(Gln) amidotransferase subunit GatC [Candidatus Omnitrophota bacterium]
MAMTVKDVEYLAHLARIQLTTDELQRFRGQLDEILAYVEKLKGAATEGVAPTSHVLELANVFREDQVQPSLPLEETLANAPDRQGPFFKVPRIIEPTS